MSRSKKYSGLILSSKRGFSVVEGLIAAGMMSIVALSTVSLLYGLKKTTSPEAAVCMGYAQSILSRFRAVGQYPLTIHNIPFGGSRNPGIPFSLSTSMQVSDANRWSGLAIMGTGALPTLANFQLINGSVNAVMAVYNSADVTNAICTSPGTGFEVTTVNGVGRLSIPQQLNPGTAKVYYLITPYDTLTGTVGACTRPLYILPTPAQNFSASPGGGVAVGPGPVIAGGPLVSNLGTRNTGFLFRVNVVYDRKTETGTTTETCFSESRFQYEADSTQPLTPDRFSVSGSYVNTSVTTTNTYTIHIGSMNLLKRGSVLVCRDRSFYPGTAAAPTALNLAYRDVSTAPAPNHGAWCKNGAANVYTVVGSEANGAMRPPYFPSTIAGPAVANASGLLYSNGAPYEFSGSWVPCENVTVCGSNNPTSSTINSQTSLQPDITLNYSNLPRYCRIRIEVGVIDTAQNAKTSATGNLANVFPVTESRLFQANDVDYPRQQCKVWCMNNDSAVFPNGYWANSVAECPSPCLSPGGANNGGTCSVGP